MKKMTKKTRTIIICVAVFLLIGVISGVSAFNNRSKLTSEIKECLSSNNYEKAEQLLNKLKTSDGTIKDVYLLYSDFYIAQSKYADALSILEVGVKNCSTDEDLNAKIDLLKSSHGDDIAKQQAEKIAAEQETSRLNAESKAAEDEAKRKAEEEKTAKEKDDFLNSCEPFNYNEVNRNPDNFKDKHFKFTGKVIQSQEPTFGNTVELRINVTKGEYGIWEDTIYATVKIPDGFDRILENDIINIYGVCDGMTSYTSVLGQKISLPKINIKYYSIG